MFAFRPRITDNRLPLPAFIRPDQPISGTLGADTVLRSTGGSYVESLRATPVEGKRIWITEVPVVELRYPYFQMFGCEGIDENLPSLCARFGGQLSVLS